MSKYLTKALTLPNGKRKYIRAKTKAELERKIDAIKEEIRFGVDVSSTSTFREYTDRWVEVVKKPYLTTNSYNNMVSRLKYSIYPVIGDIKIRDIKASHIRQTMAGMAHLCKATQGNALSLMRAIFNSAVDDNLIMRSPVPLTLKPRGKATEEVEALTQAQVDELLRVASKYSIYPFIYLVLHTGLRRGEACALTWHDVDFEGQVIHVRSHLVPGPGGTQQIVSGAKTKAGVRDVPMPLSLMAYLKTRRASSRSIYVVPNADGGLMSIESVSSRFETLNRHLSFHVHAHQLRHTYITHLFEAGLDVEEIKTIAGHESVMMTLGIYTHYRKAARMSETITAVQAAFG